MGNELNSNSAAEAAIATINEAIATIGFVEQIE